MAPHARARYRVAALGGALLCLACLAGCARTPPRAADTEKLLPHHDAAPLPNGDVLVLAWERKSREEAIRAGRDPALVGRAGLRPDCLVQIRPERPAGGRIVWEWHAWDHLRPRRIRGS